MYTVFKPVFYGNLFFKQFFSVVASYIFSYFFLIQDLVFVLIIETYVILLYVYYLRVDLFQIIVRF